MATRKDKHQERLDDVAFWGKDLARRAGRVCEWCGENDDCRPYDSFSGEEPALDTLALLCARCRAVAEGRKDDPVSLRFLETAVWHEVRGVSAPAQGALRRVDADWARATAEILPEAE